MPINAIQYLNAPIKVPPRLGSWLYTVKSLTDKLYSIKGCTDLKVLSQQWVQTNWWCQQMLGLQKSQLLIREIMMQCDGLAYWYARSIIPKSCYRLNPEFFDRLQKESIRNLIFNNDQVERKGMITYPVDKLCLEWYWVKKFLPDIDAPLWLRLTEYCFLSQQSFYVVELLLPELETLL